MIRDKYLKTLLVPLLGIMIPVFSNLVHVHFFSPVQLVITNMLFVLAVHLVWQGSVYMVARMRNGRRLRKMPLVKLLVVSGAAAMYCFCLMEVAFFVWCWYLPEFNDPGTFLRMSIACSVFVIILTLVYESLFLTKEVELEGKVVQLLDGERVHAEVKALKFQLDPHFLFNSLHTLSYLVGSEKEDAQLFLRNLGKVYKYFVVNRDRDLVSLKEELELVDEYYYLLRIRFGNRVQLSLDVNEQAGRLMLPPFSVQLAVENAIKHNAFSDQKPLVIGIKMQDEYVCVENSVRERLFVDESTGMGLDNLARRYRLICGKEIQVLRHGGRFEVCLPVKYK